MLFSSSAWAGIQSRAFCAADGGACWARPSFWGAQTELPLLREAVCAVGYRIRREEIAVEDGRAYVLMRCDPCGEDEPPYSEEELLLGPVLLTERPSAWQPILERREALLRGGISAMEAAALPKDRKRLERFRRELLYVRNALARF